MATEAQHQLDIVLDIKKPHWQMVQDMLVLFNSAVLYSNGKYKIISDRSDLPVRQVFHAGNMLTRAEVRVAQDPAAINQITAEFSNRDIGYERDMYILQDSAQIYGSNAPIKNTDISLTGLTRPTEVARRLDFEMQRRQQQVREVTFQTGLEAVAVEPGDHCIVGVLLTDYELGWGGRALDGSTTSFVADREVSLTSGTVYDLWIWHTAADTPEQRTVTGSATQIRIVPTAPFDYAVSSGDRWALGVQSQDLILAVVKQVATQENGIIQIVADEFVPITVRQDCPNSLFQFTAADIPSQPNKSATFTGSNCVACFQFTYATCQGGLTSGLTAQSGWVTGNSGYNTFAAILNQSLHPPVESTLNGNTLSFVSGANSGLSTAIFCYTINGSNDQPGTALFGIMPNPVASGTAYYVTFNTSPTGFRVDVSSGGQMGPAGTFFGNSGCVQLSAASTIAYVRAVPFNSFGDYNQNGCWVFSIGLMGCFDFDTGPATSPVSITTQSLTTLMSAVIPGSLMTPIQPVQMRAIGLINDTCVASEVTQISFGLIYVSSTVIDSLVIDLRTAAGSSVGSSAPFTLKATFAPLTVPDTFSVRVTLEYDGACAEQTFVSTLLYSGIMSIDFTIPQSMAFTTKEFHTDTTGAVHSHGCHSVVLDRGEFQILGTV